MLLLCVFPSAQPAEILLSSPSVGEDLHILVEGAGNATAQAMVPGGQVVDVQLVNGEGKIKADAPGRYTVGFGGAEKTAIVPDTVLMLPGKKGEEFDFASIAVFAVALSCVFSGIAFAAWQIYAKGERLLDGKPAQKPKRMEENGQKAEKRRLAKAE